MDELKRKRGTIKGGFTRLETFIQTSLSNEELTSAELQTRLERVIQLFSEFNEIQDKIEQLVDDNGIAAENNEREVIEEKYFTIRGKLQTKLNTLNNETSSQNNQSELSRTLMTLTNNQNQISQIMQNLANARSSTPDRTNDNNTTIIPKAKLPTLNLSTFTGDYRDWPSFFDLFKSVVHNNDSIPISQKFQYLKLSLKGEAESTLKNLSITDANYEIAIDLLREKYDKEDYIIEAHLATIMNIESIRYPSNIGLRKIKNTFDETVRALDALKVDTKSWDCWLIYVLISKLDKETQVLWRRETADKKRPTFKSLLTFLEHRIYELSAVSKSTPTVEQTSKLKSNKVNFTHSSTVSCCPNCKGSHQLYQCNLFLQMSLTKRKEYIHKLGYCFNCLRGKHLVKDCFSNARCIKCHKRHHTLLHEEEPSRKDNVKETPTVTSATSFSGNKKIVNILPTAIIKVKDSMGRIKSCRCLLDSGSQVTLISEACVQSLRLKRSNGRILISGIGGDENKDATTKGKVVLTLTSCYDNQSVQTTAFIIKKLTHELPSTIIETKSSNWLKELKNLADPSFQTPSKIDIILGCEVFFDILKDERKSDPNSNLKACNTIFGWVISGHAFSDVPRVHCSVVVDIDQALQNFWKLEEVENKTKTFTKEEEECENIFENTHTRLNDGSYMTRLPFKQSSDILGTTQNAAMKRLLNMERRFIQDPEYEKQYKEFMKEYEEMNHMTKVCTNYNDTKGYYLPHHGVHKIENNNGHLVKKSCRVVFDGSTKSTSGIALNEVLHTGAKMHNELCDILLKFRKGKVGYVADIKKMFRMIWVHPDDRKFQRILWRNSENEDIMVYELNTVTYGTSCAPYLSLRVLNQLSSDESQNYPRGAEMLKYSFYVDDLMQSDDSIEEAILNKNEIINILQCGKFELHKWASNDKRLLESIPTGLHADLKSFKAEENSVVKTLGLNWHANIDMFSFTVSTKQDNILTKRSILSIVSRIFDPIGLVSPCTVLVKILLQRLWSEGLSWDDKLPLDISNTWQKLCMELSCLEEVKVPRWINYKMGANIQLHGFADASENAYAACIYARIIDNENCWVNLVIAKTKVAPINQVSIPRLELCGAYLLAKLFSKVIPVLNIKGVQVYAWTDSTVVLGWLNDFPRKWSTFVGNRTSYILDVLPYKQWNHIESSQNPADLGSRGTRPQNLLNCELWWKGPEFLQDPGFKVLTQKEKFSTSKELKKQKPVTLATTVVDDILHKYSSFTRLLRICTWIRRFYNNCKSKIKKEIVINQQNYISTKETEETLLCLIKYSQSTTFEAEITTLKNQGVLSTKNKLAALDPFLDEAGVLRVGGRIKNADVAYDHRHPIILHKTDKLSVLLVRYYHHKFLHAGARLLETNIRLKYWIIGVKYIIRKCIYQCTTCIRYRGQVCSQKMSDLPSSRVQLQKPFYNTGVDYAGPFILRSWKGRGAKELKSYIAVFVCMATKALHLELVVDLSSSSFIAAFERLISRRGEVKNLFSDNGTNFKGAVKHIKEVYEYFNKNENNTKIHDYFTDQQITWKFIPPGAPNFGGLWEAGVKSVKFHLKRVAGTAKLTYDEFYTLLCKIESVLNSRPLVPLFNEIDDIEALTPNHFLTGHKTGKLPEIPLSDTNSLKTRWQLVQSMQDSFWQRWQKDYLSTLQQRHKWVTMKSNLKTNDLVVIIEPNTAPGFWLMGRIQEVLPGKDGLVRVVVVRTKNGLVKRPVNKLVLLTPENDSTK